MRKLLSRLKQAVLTLFLSEKAKRHGLVGPANIWKSKREFQIEFLRSQGLQATDKFLDLGCGTLRGGIPIIQYLDQGNYTGIDVRKEVFVEAKKELVEEGVEGKNPNLIHFQHFRDLSQENHFDVILAFAVLFHLEDEICSSCFEYVGKALKKGGRFFANANTGVHVDDRWMEFPVVMRPKEFYKNLAVSNGLTINSLGSMKELGHSFGVKNWDTQEMFVFEKA